MRTKKEFDDKTVEMNWIRNQL